MRQEGIFRSDPGEEAYPDGRVASYIEMLNLYSVQSLYMQLKKNLREVFKKNTLTSSVE